jgi:hypothetical protein
MKRACAKALAAQSANLPRSCGGLASRRASVRAVLDLGGRLEEAIPPGIVVAAPSHSVGAGLWILGNCADDPGEDGQAASAVAIVTSGASRTLSSEYACRVTNSSRLAARASSNFMEGAIASRDGAVLRR